MLASMLLGVVPLLLGLLFELVVVAPLRVPLDQSPVFFPWQVSQKHGKNCTKNYNLGKC